MTRSTHDTCSFTTLLTSVVQLSQVAMQCEGRASEFSGCRRGARDPRPRAKAICPRRTEYHPVREREKKTERKDRETMKEIEKERQKERENVMRERQ